MGGRPPPSRWETGRSRWAAQCMTGLRRSCTRAHPTGCSIATQRLFDYHQTLRSNGRSAQPNTPDLTHRNPLWVGGQCRSQLTDGLKRPGLAPATPTKPRATHPVRIGTTVVPIGATRRRPRWARISFRSCIQVLRAPEPHATDWHAPRKRPPRQARDQTVPAKVVALSTHPS